jgi:hypothetical protein
MKILKEMPNFKSKGGDIMLESISGKMGVIPCLPESRGLKTPNFQMEC